MEHMENNEPFGIEKMIDLEKNDRDIRNDDRLTRVAYLMRDQIFDPIPQNMVAV